MNQINEDMARAKAEIKKESDALQEFGKSLKDYTVGSPDYKRTEEEIVQPADGLADVRAHAAAGIHAPPSPGLQQGLPGNQPRGRILLPQPTTSRW